MATENWVIRLPRTDQVDQPILIHVSRKSGGHTLDLDLLATDGESAYRAKVRNRKVEKLRFAGYEGTPEEWSGILQYVFAASPSNPLSDDLRDTLNIACAVSVRANKTLLIITVRQVVEGITHKFGSIDLTYSQDTHDVDLFTWANEAAEKRDILAAELTASNRRFEKAEENVKSLREQLQNLIVAKEEHETQLLSKFAMLLNEKKLRIRSQQRQIAQQDQHPTSKTALNMTNRKKRKSKPASEAANAETSDSEGFDTMSIDQERIAGTQDSEDDGASFAGSATASESEEFEPRAGFPIKPAQELTIPPMRRLPFEPAPDHSEQSKLDGGPTTTTDEQDDATASEDDEL